MAKFRMSLPLRISEFRESMLRLQHELALVRNSFRAAGTTTAQGQMLVEIERSQPLNIVTLTNLLGLDKSTVSQTLAQLQRLQWIELKENPADRRYKIVALTAGGQERVDLIEREFDQQLTALLADLSEQERNAIAFGVGSFAHILEQRRQNLESSEASALPRGGSDKVEQAPEEAT
jgi:DNA-binding MarR family transcriptional regulator